MTSIYGNTSRINMIIIRSICSGVSRSSTSSSRYSGWSKGFSSVYFTIPSKSCGSDNLTLKKKEEKQKNWANFGVTKQMFTILCVTINPC